MKIGKRIREIIRLFRLDYLLCFFTQNKNVNSIIGKFIPENIQYSSSEIRIVVRNKIRFKLDISDYQEWLIYYGLTNDKPIKLFELVKSNYFIIDVGCNVGQTSLELSNLINSENKIYAFEPDIINYNKAKENIELNFKSNILLYNLGLGSKKEILFMNVNPTNRGANRLVKEGNNDLKSQIVILDDFILNEKIERVDLIKIDTEGFELNVLKGAKDTLYRFKPILFIELDNENLKQQGTSAKELIVLLTDIGYEIKNVDTNSFVKKDYLFDKCHFDILCTFPN